MSEVARYIGRDVKLGNNVKIWHFTYIGDRCEIGDDTKIGSLTHIDYDVKIGRGCRIQGMVYIPPLTVIEDDVFIGPGVLFTNDPYPPSERLAGVRVRKGSVIGAGAIIKAGVVIGEGSVVGMGSLVTRDVPSNIVVYGFPARGRMAKDGYIKKQRLWSEFKI